MAYSNQNESFEFDYTPGFTKNTHEYGQEFGDEFHAPAVVELLASMVAYSQRGVTLAGGNGVLPTGCVLGKVAATGKYKAYTSGASDGSQTALGFLRNARDTGGSSSPSGKVSTDCQGNLVYRGTLRLGLLSGTDTNNVTGAAGGLGSGTVTALGGRTLIFGSGINSPAFPGSLMDNAEAGLFIF
jgi:Bacteriophage lambda head decoration protein D